MAAIKGAKTPGIDEITLTTAEQKMDLINQLKMLKGYKAKPVRRIFIPKSGGTQRPLGIPTIFDRCVQTLFLFTIEPIVEEISCERSYGFRIGRSLKDATTYLWLNLANMHAIRRVILCADIRKIFDLVSHDWLLENVLMDKGHIETVS